MLLSQEVPYRSPAPQPLRILGHSVLGRVQASIHACVTFEGSGGGRTRLIVDREIVQGTQKWRRLAWMTVEIEVSGSYAIEDDEKDVPVRHCGDERVQHKNIGWYLSLVRHAHQWMS